ncbi:poly(A) RNA polymerase GLD2 isoform X1 [Geospiza fortis]|uniref:polynucleotide adenylyltransferase n=2 Tax=Thraupidae TaxID=400783 RepID=A0A6I9ZCC8_GEOFO|nr:poly(A) RNA polymerase GLD2 isoform X1 [Geospiza fortis]
MFPNSSNLGRPPFPPKYQQQSPFFTKLPLNMPPTLLSHQQIVLPPFHLCSPVLSRALLSGSVETSPAVTPAVTLQPVTYGSVSPVSTPDALMSFQGRKRQSQQSVRDDAKRQRIHSQDSDTAVVNQAVPLPKGHRRSFTASVSVQSPVLHASGSPALIGCVPPLQDTLFPDPTETRLPVAKDELSKQVLELFQACRQQAIDLDRKELCRTELQREIQLIFPQSRLFLVGSSLNGFGTRTSDGDLCLVIKEEPVNQKTEARCILSLVQKLFSTKLSSYIERPQLIRAKVPIVKFRDKVSNVDFDLNVNNVIGIRNTFLLRSYAFIENRVRPLVLVIKKWASFHDINDASRGTLSSYSLVLMVLHYLQTLPEPILPSLQKNYPECFDPTMQLNFVHQAPCTIPPYVSKNGSSLGDLLIGFFKYYATEFDWSHQMISVREAKAIARPDGIEWRNKFICVEEPFDGTNTARAVREKQKFDMIRGELAQAWRLLQEKKDLNCILPLKAVKQKR